MDTIKDNTDTRFSLNKFFTNEAQTKHEYRSFQREIRDNGRYVLNNVNIYTPELALILFLNELPAVNMDTQEETILNGFPYLETYIIAFNEGIKYFDTEFSISPDTMYGVNAEKYVSDIHSNYFHKRQTGGFTGWHFVKENFPVILTHKNISEYGYYSGIVSRVEEMIKKYPRIFQNFDKCKDHIPPQQTEKPQQKDKQYNSLDELFIDPKEMDSCINALSLCDPPLISDTGNCTGKLKSGFVVWIEVLRSKGKIHTIADKLLPDLLKAKFPGLKISASLFRQPNTRAENIYESDFKALIPKKL